MRGASIAEASVLRFDRPMQILLFVSQLPPAKTQRRVHGRCSTAASRASGRQHILRLRGQRCGSPKVRVTVAARSLHRHSFAPRAAPAPNHVITLCIRPPELDSGDSGSQVCLFLPPPHLSGHVPAILLAPLNHLAGLPQPHSCLHSDFVSLQTTKPTTEIS